MIVSVFAAGVRRHLVFDRRHVIAHHLAFFLYLSKVRMIKLWDERVHAVRYCVGGTHFHLVAFAAHSAVDSSSVLNAPWLRERRCMWYNSEKCEAWMSRVRMIKLQGERKYAVGHCLRILLVHLVAFRAHFDFQYFAVFTQASSTSICHGMLFCYTNEAAMICVFAFLNA